MSKSKFIAHLIPADCVACGCCTKVCPKNAVTIHHGIYAQINPNRCVGCGKCQKACPASIITLKERSYEKTLV